MEALTARGLTKAYGNRVALNKVNISIRQGEKVAIVGSANCGKTTALRLFAGLAIPTSGECYVLGSSPTYDAHKVHSYTGFVTDTARLYENMTLNENLSLYAKLNGLDVNDSVERISFLLHSLDIFSSRDKPVSKLSTSAQQKANLARALIHSPKILLFDEPTEGLDKETTDTVKKMIDTIGVTEDATSVICTRHLHHAQLMCDKYLIMKDGEIITRGTLEELRLGCGLNYKAVFRISDESDPPAGFEFTDDGSWVLEIQDEEEMSKLISKSVLAGCDIREAVIKKPTLEEVYDEYITGRYLKVSENIGKRNAESRAQNKSRAEVVKSPNLTEDYSDSAITEEFREEYSSAISEQERITGELSRDREEGV